MNTYHLKYFLDAAKTGSITASAQKNNMTHSAISQAIKNLENELGVQLLNHSKRKFELTDVAKASLGHFEQVLLQLQNLKSKIQSEDIEPQGELTIWAPQSLIVDSLIDCFALFQEKYPKIQLKIQTGAAYLVRQSVLENKCQLGIAVNDYNMKNFNSRHITDGDFVLVANSKNAKLESPNYSLHLMKKSKYSIF